jgi:hypothetical protein
MQRVRRFHELPRRRKPGTLPRLRTRDWHAKRCCLHLWKHLLLVRWQVGSAHERSLRLQPRRKRAGAAADYFDAARVARPAKPALPEPPRRHSRPVTAGRRPSGVIWRLLVSGSGAAPSSPYAAHSLRLPSRLPSRLPLRFPLRFPLCGAPRCVVCPRLACVWPCLVSCVSRRRCGPVGLPSRLPDSRRDSRRDSRCDCPVPLRFPVWCAPMCRVPATCVRVAVSRLVRVASSVWSGRASSRACADRGRRLWWQAGSLLSIDPTATRRVVRLSSVVSSGVL